MSLPRYISARDIAIALGPAWRTQRVTRVLKSMGIAKKIGGTRGVWVDPVDLAGSWGSEMYEEILEKIGTIKPTLERGRRNKVGKNGANNCGVPRKDCAPECEHAWDERCMCMLCGADRLV